MRNDTTRININIIKTEEIAEDIKQFTIRPEQEPATPYPAGSHMVFDLVIDGRAETRSYSLVGDRPDNGAWRIAVKRAPDSRGGSKAMWALPVGARLTATRPASHFELALGRPDYLLIAGGIGITPIIGMAQRLAHAGAKFRLLYAARSRGQMAFLDDLQDTLGDRLALFTDGQGQRIDLPAEIARLDPRGEVYVCGPVGMLEAAKLAWRASGRPAAHLRFETFGSSGLLPTEAFSVLVADHQRRIEVPREKSLLEALRLAGIEIACDCLRGECGLCQVNVTAVDGALDHRDVFLSAAQKQAGGKLCACVSRATGSVTIDTGYRV
jgi:vanillate O-demethylase ferredoxin subunit